ncbi:MAG: hypothetical protein ACKPKO_32790, partial [Candidatus Fonsibacter sp.]
MNLKLTQQGVVQQVNVNGFELSPDALAGVHMHHFRVFCRGAERRRHDRAAISRRGTVTSGHDSAQPAGSSGGSGSGVGTAADDDAKGFATIVERALLAHPRSQLIRPTKFALPWAIANLRDMPV